MHALSVIIVNWRTPELALRARAAIIADGAAPEQVLIVDNGSSDDSVIVMRERAPDALILVLPENVGFSAANNLGARRLPASACYLFVNSDAFVHVPGSVAALADAVAAERVGIAVPRLRNADLTLQRSVVPLSAPLAELVRASGLSRLVPDRWQPHLGTHWSHDRSRRIEAAIGAVLAVSAPAWSQVGGFDERVFMYGEDHDLFRRVRAAGFSARFVGEAEFVHLGGASSAQRWGDEQRAERVARAEAQALVREMAPVPAVITVGLMALGVGARAVVLRLAGRRLAAAVQRGWWRGYVGILRSRRCG